MLRLRSSGPETIPAFYGAPVKRPPQNPFIAVARAIVRRAQTWLLLARFWLEMRFLLLRFWCAKQLLIGRYCFDRAAYVFRQIIMGGEL